MTDGADSRGAPGPGGPSTERVPRILTRDEHARREEREGRVVVQLHRFVGEAVALSDVVVSHADADAGRARTGTMSAREVGALLAAFAELVSKLLPEMAKAYIWRIVFDTCHDHRSLLVVKDGRVTGGICFRTFAARGFVEIVFCVVAHEERRHGYGTHMMNHMKEVIRQEGIHDMLVFADTSAVTYFARQGFTTRIDLPERVWSGYIKSYQESTLMHCQINRHVPSFLRVPEMLQAQREALDALLPRGITTVTPLLLPPSAKRHCSSSSSSGTDDNDTGVTIGLADESTSSSSSNSTSGSKISADYLRRRWTAEMGDLLNRIRGCREGSWPFLQPVDTRFVPGYLDVIETPCDLSLIERRLNDQVYRDCPTAFLNDVQLMIDNCKTFNPDPRNEYNAAAVTLERTFAQRMAQLRVSFAQRPNDGSQLPPYDPTADGSTLEHATAAATAPATRHPKHGRR